MRNILYILAIAAITVLPSCVSVSSEKSENEEQDAIDYAIKNSDDNLELLDLYLQKYRSSGSQEDLEKALAQMKKSVFEYDEDTLTMEQKKLYLQQKLKADKQVDAVRDFLSSVTKHTWVTISMKDDYLMNKGAEAFPIYAKKGDRLKISITSAEPFTVNIYNAESQRKLRTLAKKTMVDDSFDVQNTAIYLVEVVPTDNQYIDLTIQAQSSDISILNKERQITEQEVEAKKGDFMARRLEGVSMKNLFEEPRKFTLRGQLKSLFSGSSRAIVALQVPAGAKDVMYALRISTNERAQAADGQFYDNMCTSYRKIKFMGLPLYESQKGSGLLATLLGENVPIREEDAYINMYVFMDAGQARKFQNNVPTSSLNYHVDYSTIGTQSCNGRIPAQGKKTIYLGFENERMRYNNYVWLEAISAVPNQEYYKIQYSIE